MVDRATHSMRTISRRISPPLRTSGAKVIALANAGGDTINAVKQAAEIGISPRSQTLVPLLVFISDVDSLGLDVAKGMTFVDGFYWDLNNETRQWSKRFYARRRAMPTMAHAGVYSAVAHYLRAIRSSGTDEAKTIAKTMRELPVDDFFAPKGLVRPDGRLLHDMYLVEVKPPRGIPLSLGLLQGFVDYLRWQRF